MGIYIHGVESHVGQRVSFRFYEARNRSQAVLTSKGAPPARLEATVHAYYVAANVHAESAHRFGLRARVCQKDYTHLLIVAACYPVLLLLFLLAWLDASGH